MRKLAWAAVLSLVPCLVSLPARADKIDDIVKAGQIRCGSMLDFPPAGFRDAKNEPDGYDVQVCKDIAKALGVRAIIVETSSSERVPALVANRIDVLIASTSNTLERAKTVAFSAPYVAYTNVVLTRADTGVKSFDDLKGRAVGGVTGTTTEGVMLAGLQAWGEGREQYTGYGSEIDSYVALSQGKVDGLVVTNTVGSVLAQSPQFKALTVAGLAPSPADLCAIAVNKRDGELLRWINLFLWQQTRSGRYAELYAKYFGLGAPPVLTADGTY